MSSFPYIRFPLRSKLHTLVVNRGGTIENEHILFLIFLAVRLGEFWLMSSFPYIRFPLRSKLHTLVVNRGGTIENEHILFLIFLAVRLGKFWLMSSFPYIRFLYGRGDLVFK